MSRQGDDTYSGAMPLGIVHLGILAVTPRSRGGASNIFRLSLKVPQALGVDTTYLRVFPIDLPRVSMANSKLFL